MASLEQRYEPGDQIHVGDSVRYAGDTGTIVFVIDRGEYSPEFSENDWSHYGSRFMIQTPRLGLVMLDRAEEDLELLARAPSTV
jgi:hypothetical protein